MEANEVRKGAPDSEYAYRTLLVYSQYRDVGEDIEASLTSFLTDASLLCEEYGLDMNEMLATP